MNKSEPLFDRQRNSARHHWSFIRVGLWVSAAILFVLFFIGIRSYQQTNQLVQATHEHTGKALANGLANAIEENLIIRNFAQIEVQLLQLMSNEQLQSVIVTDAQGTILSEVHRDSANGQVNVIYTNAGKTLPNLKTNYAEHDKTIEITQPSGNISNVGWIRIQIAVSSDSAVLEGIHQKLSISLGLSAIVMLLIVGFSLRRTYSQVTTTQNEMEALNDSLHAAAFYDPLTKLPNRHLLNDRLKQALALAARSHNQVAVCYLDLDGFKSINDQFGHGAGDALLVEIAKRLILSVRQHDTVARIGGDEFVLVITELHEFSECQILIDRLLIDVSQPVEIDSHIVTTTASIGICMSHTYGIDPATLIARADNAMYKAKINGKNCWRFDQP